MTVSPDVEALNDRLAREHPIDDYYARSPLPVRLIERRRLAIISDMVGEHAGLRILEVGSGGGHVLSMFRGAKLLANDVSDEFLSVARRNLAGYDVTFVKGEIDRLHLEAASFDRVVCTEVLEHTRNPEAILREIARLVAPRGRAVITVPNDPLIAAIKRTVRRTPVGWALRDRIEWGGDRYHLHEWVPDEFRRLLERWFVVRRYDASPHPRLPIRACFACEPR